MKSRRQICLSVALLFVAVICILQSDIIGGFLSGGKFKDTTLFSKIKEITGTGNREIRSGKDGELTEVKSHGQKIESGSKKSGINERKEMEPDVKLSVVYSVDVLLNELKKIHDKLYSKPKNDTCKVRPAGCVIIGVAKSGTQELLNFLSLHPNVVIKNNLPNPNLFDTDSHLNSRNEKMPCTYSDQIGVVKTDYFFFREEMPSKFYKFNPNLKMILIVREPVERLISAYSFTFLQNKQRRLVFNYKVEDVPEINNIFVDQRNGSVKKDQFDLSHSVYDVPMERYLELFTREQILVLESSEFRNDPVKVLQRVEKFLDLKPVITDEYFEYNQSKHFYCLKGMLRVICYGSDRGRVRLKEIKAETRRKLQEYFKPHNEKFFSLVGQKFNWSSI